MKALSTVIAVVFRELLAASEKVVKMSCIGTNGTGLGEFQGFADVTFFASDLGEGTEIASFLASLTAGDVIHIPVYLGGHGEYLNCTWNKKCGLPVLTDQRVAIPDKDAPEISPALKGLLKPMPTKKDKDKDTTATADPQQQAMLALMLQQFAASKPTTTN